MPQLRQMTVSLEETQSMRDDLDMWRAKVSAMQLCDALWLIPHRPVRASDTGQKSRVTGSGSRTLTI